MKKQNLELPLCLQYTDAELRTMTVAQMRDAFAIAEKSGVLEQFTEAFWKNINRVRSEPTPDTIERIVRTLEARKRDLGRRYDAEVRKYNYRHIFVPTLIAIQYNDIEYQIRWLCLNYPVQRTTKAYLLKVC